MIKKLRVLSLGAGVQSSTLALLIEKGEVPMVDYAIFSDTQAEPSYVYDYLEKLKKLVSYPIHIVTAGNLEKDSLQEKFIKIPVYTVNVKTGDVGFGRRQCTREYKITPIIKKMKELSGFKKHQRIPKNFKITMLMGISRDEMQRATENRERWIINEYPLIIEKRFNRGDCLAWMEKQGYDLPERSACYFCPYNSNASWKRIRDTQPKLWQQAIEFDEKIRTKLQHDDYEAYLHKECRPLKDIDLDPNKDQMDMFNDICDDGMCGV